MNGGYVASVKRAEVSELKRAEATERFGIGNVQFRE